MKAQGCSYGLKVAVPLPESRVGCEWWGIRSQSFGSKDHIVDPGGRSVLCTYKHCSYHEVQSNKGGKHNHTLLRQAAECLDGDEDVKAQDGCVT